MHRAAKKAHQHVLTEVLVVLVTTPQPEAGDELRAPDCLADETILIAQLGSRKPRGRLTAQQRSHNELGVGWHGRKLHGEDLLREEVVLSASHDGIIDAGVGHGDI